MEKSFYFEFASLIIVFLILSCQNETPYTLNQEGLIKFIGDYEKRIEPMATSYSQAQWDAYTTGKSEYFELSTDLSLKIDSLYQQRSHFDFLRDLRDKNIISDPQLNRQLDILYTEYLKRNINPELNKKITELTSKIESVFANYRTMYNGKTYSDNQVTLILKEEKNNDFRREIWRAQKGLGNKVAEDIIKLTKLRNQAAVELGYQTYYDMAMDTRELDASEVEAVFEELYRLTEQPFSIIHQNIEKVFSNRYGIDPSQIRPWHYEDLFAQGAPAIFEIELDSYYKDTNIPQTAQTFFTSTGVPVADILNRSDLYEREGKNQHAYSFCIDRKQDIRILCNIVPNERWMETMLHELGHAVYDKYIDQSLPFTLREPAHSFTTEGIAMFYGSFSSNAGWMQRALGISKREKENIEKVTRANLQLSKLIFARWSMVVLNFEKNLYFNPDQDLNTLWWDLVEKFQFIKRPDEPLGAEWATKIHIPTYPVYYQNYQLGELFASQVLNYIAQNFYDDDMPIEDIIFWNNKDAGKYLVDHIFRPGKSLPWNDMIEKATGEPLSAKYFVNQYISSP